MTPKSTLLIPRIDQYDAMALKIHEQAPIAASVDPRMSQRYTGPRADDPNHPVEEKVVVGIGELGGLLLLPLM